jgi:phosphatidylethanolamine-binding protein (PEBP) family uncharacterized protein
MTFSLAVARFPMVVPFRSGTMGPGRRKAMARTTRLAALDVPVLEVDADSKVAELWRAAEPHILAEAEFVGTYETS